MSWGRWDGPGTRLCTLRALQSHSVQNGVTLQLSKLTDPHATFKSPRHVRACDPWKLPEIGTWAQGRASVLQEVLEIQLPSAPRHSFVKSQGIISGLCWNANQLHRLSALPNVFLTNRNYSPFPPSEWIAMNALLCTPASIPHTPVSVSVGSRIGNANSTTGRGPGSKIWEDYSHSLATSGRSTNI